MIKNDQPSFSGLLYQSCTLMQTCEMIQKKNWKYNECTKCYFKETCLRDVKWKKCYFSKMSQVTCLNIIHVPYKNMFIWYCNINSYIICPCCRQQETLKWKVNMHGCCGMAQMICMRGRMSWHMQEGILVAWHLSNVTWHIS